MADSGPSAELSTFKDCALSSEHIGVEKTAYQPKAHAVFRYFCLRRDSEHQGRLNTGPSWRNWEMPLPNPSEDVALLSKRFLQDLSEESIGGFPSRDCRNSSSLYCVHAIIHGYWHGRFSIFALLFICP